MNQIDSIVVHCTATKAGVNLKAKDIDRMHRLRGFTCIGYHFLILLDGTIEAGRALSMTGAHCNTKGFSGKSYNYHSVGISYVGGLNSIGKATDTRTPEQKKALETLIQRLCKEYPIKEILGHRDTSPDLDGDGEVEPHEWVKYCPCFDAKKEYDWILKGSY